MEINCLINKIIENQKENTIKGIDFCCAKCDFNNSVNIIENDKIKIIYTNNGECEIRRKKNNNPVICRDEKQNIYRQHGEWNYLKYEMLKLAGMNKEAEKLQIDLENRRQELINKNYQYD